MVVVYFYILIAMDKMIITQNKKENNKNLAGTDLKNKEVSITQENDKRSFFPPGKRPDLSPFHQAFFFCLN